LKKLYARLTTPAVMELMNKNVYCVFAIILIISSALSAQVKMSTEEQVDADSLGRIKRQLLDNSGRLESLLKQNAAYLQSLKEMDAKPETVRLDEVEILIKQYEGEDRTNPAVDSIMQEYDMKYRFYSQEARQQRKKMEQYNTVRFAVDLGGGGFFLYPKSGLLFGYGYSHWHYSTWDFGFDTLGHFPKNYVGFSSSLALSCYIKRNISLEFNYMYAISHVDPVAGILHLTPSPYPAPEVAADDHYISTYSISFIGNYSIEITPEFKSILGLGVTYIQSSAPGYLYESSSGGAIESKDVRVSAVSYYSDYWGALVRVGFELPLNIKKTVTLQILCDGRFPLSSSTQELPRSLQPYLRLVWHI
jgi:hypothetical protein